MKSLSDCLNRYSTKVISKANQKISAHEAITSYNIRSMVYDSICSNIYRIRFCIVEYLNEATKKNNTK